MPRKSHWRPKVWYFCSNLPQAGLAEKHPPQTLALVSKRCEKIILFWMEEVFDALLDHL
jgi:hypothetical protein